MGASRDTSIPRKENRRYRASGALGRWLCRRQAFRYYDCGRAIELAAGDPSGAVRAARIYGRGLRVLRTAYALRVSADGLSARDRLDWALAVSGPWPRFWSWSRRRRWLSVGAATATLIFAAAVVFALVRVARPKNLAAGQPWRASSSDAGFPGEGHLADAAAPVAFMHTGEEDHPSVVIDLQRPLAISRVEVHNRVDCCADRAVPLVIEGSSDGQLWTTMARRVSVFSVWRAAVPEQSVRFVRVRLDQRGILHLRAIRLF